jgi:hypothetical protein
MPLGVLVPRGRVGLFLPEYSGILPGCHLAYILLMRASGGRELPVDAYFLLIRVSRAVTSSSLVDFFLSPKKRRARGSLPQQW